jgi:hypothetical protein
VLDELTASEQRKQLEAVMRQLKESTLVSLDGVIGEPHLWASERFDDEARAGALAPIVR